MPRAKCCLPQHALALLICVPLAVFGAARGGDDAPVQPLPGRPVIIPTRYTGDRFLAVPTVEKGSTLTFFTDSAGGTFIFAATVERLKLATVEMPSEEQATTKMRLAELPAFNPKTAIPPPLGVKGGRLFVF